MWGGACREYSWHSPHEILKIADYFSGNLNHRGAIDADAKTGDGAGILTQIPHELLPRWWSRWGIVCINLRIWVWG
ncbi:MAG: hypothetical protein R3F23_08680 [Verrucomicrobiia bacterium]